MKTLALALSIAGLAAAAGNQAGDIHGQYVEARTADIYTGPCFANSEVELTGNLAVLGWKIEKGAWQGVSLDGLSVMGVVRSDNTLGDYMHPDVVNARAVLIVDDRATPEQRIALGQFAKQMGGDLLANIVRTEARPITFSAGDMHSRQAKMVAGELAKVETRALEESDKICHNEEVWYKPLTQLDHAMAAYTVEQSYQGKGLNTTWSYPGKRSAYVGTFSTSGPSVIETGEDLR
jgi:hypothetical protein